MSEADPYQRGRWIALILLCFAQFVVVLDATIVNIALPTMGRALSFSQENLSWVVNAYVLAFGGCLLLGGRLADLLGRRRVFVWGLLLVGAASLAAGFAADAGQLIAARAAQGLGAAIISPAALSIVTTTFGDGAGRNTALGVWGAVAGSAGAVGVLLGGVLTNSVGWQWVMWLNVPIALIVAALTPRYVAESRSRATARRLDLAGAATVTGGLAVLVYAIAGAAGAGPGSARTLGLIGLATVLLAAFAAIERRSAAPLVPFAIFRLRALTGANAVGALVGGALGAMFFFLTLYLQQVLGYKPIQAGLAHLPLAVTIIVTAGVASRLVTKLGFKPVLVIGLTVLAGALAWFSRISADGAFLADVLGPSILAGIGLGLTFVPVTIAAVAGVREQESGLAGGLINTSQQIGGALGLAVLATIATSRTGDLMAASHGDPGALPNALTEGFRAAYIGGSAIAVLGVVLTLTVFRGGDCRTHIAPGPAPESEGLPSAGQ